MLRGVARVVQRHPDGDLKRKTEGREERRGDKNEWRRAGGMAGMGSRNYKDEMQRAWQREWSMVLHAFGGMSDLPHVIVSRSLCEPPWHIVVKSPSTQFDAGYFPLSCSLSSAAFNPVTLLPSISNTWISCAKRQRHTYEGHKKNAVKNVGRTTL